MTIRRLSRLRGCLWALLCVLLAGCATPEYRIRKNPEVFAGATPDQQEKIQRGEIDIGFTPELVRLAWGKPTRIFERTSHAGIREVWSYRTSEPGGAYPPYGSTRLYDRRYYSVPRRVKIEWGRVVFADGAVIEYERTDSAAGIR